MEIVIATPIWDGSSDQSDFTENFVVKCLDKTIGDFALCLIDNASTSFATYQFLSSLTDPRIHIIRNKTNLGYGRAANQGIRWGLEQGATYGVIMNNDIEILDKNWLELLIAPLRENRKQLIGARLITFNGATAYDGKNIIPYLEGWCLAFHKDFVSDIGLMDEGMFCMHEDVDLSMRAERGGYPIVQSPDFEWDNRVHIPIRGTTFHFYGRTAYRRPDFNWQRVTEESRQYMLQKWGFSQVKTEVTRQ